MDTVEVVTLITAIVGAVTGAVALAVSAMQFRLSGHRIEVVAQTALVGGREWMISVEVRNNGRMPVDVQSLSLAVSGKMQIPLGHPPDMLFSVPAAGPPWRIEPFSAKTWLVRPERLALGLQERGERGGRFEARLSTGDRKRSKRFDVVNVALLD